MSDAYALKGHRPGFVIKPEWTRIDCPPNARGHRYTEFRDARGECVAVYMTGLLKDARHD